jgi:hypothetical protein
VSFVECKKFAVRVWKWKGDEEVLAALDEEANGGSRRARRGAASSSSSSSATTTSSSSSRTGRSDKRKHVAAAAAPPKKAKKTSTTPTTTDTDDAEMAEPDNDSADSSSSSSSQARPSLKPLSSNPSNEDVLNHARACLHPSTAAIAPETQRSVEHEYILNYVKDSAKSWCDPSAANRPGSLYCCGGPGTGKSVTIGGVTQAAEEWAQSTKVSSSRCQWSARAAEHMPTPTERVLGGACEGFYGGGVCDRQPEILPASAAEEQLPPPPLSPVVANPI